MIIAIKSWATKYASHPLAPVFVGCYGFFGTLIEIVPVTWLLSALIAVNPKRWRTFLVVSALGGSIGGLALTWVFHKWGLSWVLAHYPGVVGSSGWQSIEFWVDSYGFWGLAIVAASPLALTPGLVVCGLMKMQLASVWLAILLGKSLKYGFVSYSVRRASSAFKSLEERYFNGGKHE